MGKPATGQRTTCFPHPRAVTPALPPTLLLASGRCCVASRTVAVLLAAGLCTLAAAQTPTFTSPLTDAAPPARTASGPGTEFSGRDFAGLRLGMPTQRGTLALAATKVSTWAEDAPGLSGSPAGQTVGDSVQRLLLKGDVRIDIAGGSFSAAKAAVWIEPLRAGTSTVKPLWQVAVYFDRVGEAAGEHGVQQTGDRLLVTAVVEGELDMTAASVQSERPEGDIFLIESERRLARYLAMLASGTASDIEAGPSANIPPEPKPWEMAGIDGTRKAPVVPGQSRPFEPGSPLIDPVLMRRRAEVPAATGGPAPASPLFSKSGIITIAAGEPVLVPGVAAGESALLVTGGVVVQYTERRSDRTLQLTAQQAVIFLAGETPRELFTTSADKVLGVYLEGDVIATDGKYTIRSPRVFYDVQRGTGSMADAVFWTYDEKLSLPLYVRAKSLRQVSAGRFEASDARLATSSFFTPHLSIGARSVTVTRDAPVAGPSQMLMSAEGVTARFGELPFFYWPGFEGSMQEFPLTEVGFNGSSNTGYGVKTRWNMFGLAGITPWDGVKSDLLIDGFTKRGAAIGTLATVDRADLRGNLFGYVVPDDRGTDESPSGSRLDRSGDFRGMIFTDARVNLDNGWTAFVQGSYISDERFVDSYFRRYAETERELTNQGLLRNISGNSAFAITGRFSANDFIANDYLIQSQGYSVGKIPELTYVRVNDNILPDAAPGLLGWNQEYRIGAMQMRFNEPTNREMGLDTNALAQQAFGQNANESLASRLRARGFTDEPILRLDTRQEVVMALDYGPVKIEPFVTARATMYDDNFKDFATAAGSQDDDRLRLWGAGGVRSSTSFQKVDKSVKSEFFDISGTRHIVEPSVTFMAAGTTRDAQSLPVYDDRVENLLQGNIVRGGVMQTWQTMRGGPGRRHTVDFLKVNADVMWSPDSTPKGSPIGRFYDYRPEYSQAGKFGIVDAVWQVTDSTALTSGITYDMDLNQPARTSAGVKLDHSADFSTFAELRYLNARDTTYVDLGGQLRLTPKYVTTGYATYDTDRAEVQNVTARIDREFPDLTFGLGIRYDQITDNFSFTVDFRPLAQDSRRGQMERLRGSRIDPGLGDIPEVQSRSGWFSK